LRIRHAGSVVLKLCMTPLGLPVVPDVNAMRMTSLASIACGLNAADASLPAMSSSSGTVPGTPVPPSTSTDSSAGSPGRSSLIIATYSKSLKDAGAT